MQDDQIGLGSNTVTNLLRIKQKIMRVYILNYNYGDINLFM